MLRGEKKDDDSMDEKSFPDLSGDGKVTMKDILMGRGVIKKGKKKKSMEEGSIKDDPEAFKKAKAKAKAKGQKTEMPKPKESIDIRAAAVEGLKKVCWGDKYNEAYRPGEEKTVRKEINKDLAQAKETPQQKRDRERKEMEARKKEFADFYKKK